MTAMIRSTDHGAAGRPPHPAALASLVERIAAGDRAAIPSLIGQLLPWLTIWATYNDTLKPLGGGDDHGARVASTVLDRLSADDWRRLRTYPAWQAANTGKTIVDWVRIVAKNVMRDYLRANSQPDRDADAPGRKRLLNEFIDAEVLNDHGVRPPFTNAGTVQELLNFARAHLSPEQQRRLAAWLEGAELSELAEAEGMPVEALEARHRAALAVLRRYFRPKAAR
jgi:DNA-directed RNA polymerase specialized sigma24 family protein